MSKFVLTTRYLAWAWMILIGALLITPGGTFCIKCGVLINERGYIGDPAVNVLAIGAIALGVIGFANRILEMNRQRSVSASH